MSLKTDGKFAVGVGLKVTWFRVSWVVARNALLFPTIDAWSCAITSISFSLFTVLI